MGCWCNALRECWSRSDSEISTSWRKAQVTITVNTLSFIIKTNPKWGLNSIGETKVLEGLQREMSGTTLLFGAPLLDRDTDYRENSDHSSQSISLFK